MYRVKIETGLEQFTKKTDDRAEEEYKDYLKHLQKEYPEFPKLWFTPKGNLRLATKQALTRWLSIPAVDLSMHRENHRVIRALGAYHCSNSNANRKKVYLAQLMDLLIKTSRGRMHTIPKEKLGMANELVERFSVELKRAKPICKTLNIVPELNFVIKSEHTYLELFSTIKDIVMQVYHTRNSKKPEFNLALDNPIKIGFLIDLNRYVNMNGEKPITDGLLVEGRHNHHPFANNNSICFSGYSSAMHVSIKELDLISLFGNLRMWAETFSRDATPFLAISDFWMGVPKSFGTIAQAYGANPDYCAQQYNPKKEDCDKIECLLRKTCRHNALVNGRPVPLSPNDILRYGGDFILDDETEALIEDLRKRIDEYRCSVLGPGHEFKYENWPSEKLDLKKLTKEEMERRSRQQQRPSVVAMPPLPEIEPIVATSATFIVGSSTDSVTISSDTST